MMKNKNLLHQVAYVLVWAGGLNWGLIGFFNYDLVKMLFGMSSTWVYMLVGVATVYTLATHMHYCKYCAGKK